MKSRTSIQHLTWGQLCPASCSSQKFGISPWLLFSLIYNVLPAWNFSWHYLQHIYRIQPLLSILIATTFIGATIILSQIIAIISLFLSFLELRNRNTAYSQYTRQNGYLKCKSCYTFVQYPTEGPLSRAKTKFLEWTTSPSATWPLSSLSLF